MDDSTLARLLGITGQDQATQPTAAATGTPNNPNDPTGQGDWPGKPAWQQGMPGVLQPSNPGQIRSTADLANWRQIYGAPKLFYDLPWNNLRQTETNALNSINKMPWIFNPASYWAADPNATQQMRNAIFPGFNLGENSLLPAQGQDFTSLLGSLTQDQKNTLLTTLEQMLGVTGGTQTGTTNPSTATGGTTSAPVATQGGTSTTDPRGSTPVATGPSQAPTLAPWQQALSTNNDQFFGLPANTLAQWKSTGLGRNLGVDPSTYWFFQGLSPDAQAAFMQHQSQIRGSGPGGLESILASWQQPPSNISNPLGVPYPWSSGL